MKLSRLQSVPVRDVWEHEAHSFTPWLAEDENISLLAEAVGLGVIEVEATEKSVGKFSADIVGRDDNNNYVLIENQLEATDHRHLGQVLTYLASLDGPASVIWLATEFLEEHRAAIDWLNSNTTEHFSFFAVEIETVRIGGSDVAPRFNVVAKPNSFVRSARAYVKNSEELAPRHHFRIAYWESFGGYLAGQKTRFKISRLNKDHWFEFPTGRSGFVFSATVTPQKGRIGLELYIYNDADKFYFRQLLTQRSEIERQIGYELDWQELPGKKATRIAIFKQIQAIEDEATWQLQHQWMFEALTAFERTFPKYLRDLKGKNLQFEIDHEE